MLGEGSYAKQWLWVWEQTVTSSFPRVGPIIGVEKEKYEEYIENHLKEMVESHGVISFTRSMGLKPLE
jgi:hypothetical protein